MSRQLMPQTILSVFCAVYVLSAFLCNDAYYFELIYAVFFFPFCNFSVLPLLVCLEDSANFKSVLASVCIDTVFALLLEVLFCGVNLFFFNSWFNKESVTVSFLFICSFRKAILPSNNTRNFYIWDGMIAISIAYYETIMPVLRS